MSVTAIKSPARRGRRGSRLGMRARGRHTRVLVYLVLVAGSLYMLLPLVWLLRSSLMTLTQIFRFPIEWTPNPWAWSNYPEAFDTAPLLLYITNTFIILVPVVVGTVTTASISAFGFSRLKWPGRDTVFGILLSALMLPYAVTLIPTFVVWVRLGLLNTYWPLILPSWFGGHIYYIFLLRQFFQTIPRELDEAAYIDGGNPLQVLWHVIVPLSRPALITVAVFSGLFVWNDFLGPLIYVNDSDKYTLALGLLDFLGMMTSDWHLLMAASVVSIAPVFVLFFLAQRYFVEGITLTGIKG